MAACATTVAHGDDGTWINAGGGSWSSAANWANGVIAGDWPSTADFSTLNLTTNVTVTLNGARTISRLVFGDSTPSHDWTLATGTGGPLTLEFDPEVEVTNRTATISAVVAGFSGLTKTGAGILQLSAINTYSGDTTVYEGTLRLAANSGGSGTLRGGSLYIQPGAAVTATVANALGYSGTNWTRAMEINGGTFTTSASGDQGWGLTVYMTGGSLLGSGSSPRISAGGGTNFYSRPSENISVIGVPIQLREGNPSNLVNFGAENGTAHPDMEVSGAISSPASGRGISKGGNGSVRFSGNLSLTGPFNVVFGDAILTGSVTATQLSVSAPGTLSGSGLISAPTTIQGTLAPGEAAPGTLRFSNSLTLAAGSNTRIRLSKSGGTLAADRVQGITALTLGGSLSVTTSGDDLAPGDSFTLFSASGISGNFSNVALPPLAGGLRWDTTQLASQGRISVLKAEQTITFAELPEATLGTPPEPLAATASSGLPVTYSSSDPLVATVSGNTLTLVGSGYTTLTARQAGDATFLPAPEVSRVLAVNQAVRAPQTISFSAPSTATLTTPPFALAATASSGLPVRFTSSDPEVATVTGNTVTITGAGTTILTARQPGDIAFLPAADVPLVLEVTGTPQTIAFGPLPALSTGNRPLTLQATASSGLAVSFSSSDPAIARITGNQLTPLADGTVVITATQEGNALYNVAPPVPRTLTVHPAPASLAVTPANLHFTVPSGESSTLPLKIANAAPGAVDWDALSLEESGAPGGLPAALESLLASGDTLNAPLPDRFDFTEGVSGTSINSGVPAGGNAIFTGGNLLHTNLGGPLPYSDGVLATAPATGAGGRYFTRKQPGLFLMAAELDGAAWFEVRGSHNFTNSRSVREFSLTREGVAWTGFISTAVDHWRTINHLILVDRTGLRQFVPTSQYNELHRVEGLAGKTRVYYLLYVTGTRTVPPTPVFEELANRLLDTVGGAVGSRLTLSPASGSTGGGSETGADARFEAAGLAPGNFNASLEIDSPDGAPLARVPVTVEVTAPRLSLPPGPVRHLTVLRGPAGLETVPLRSSLGGEQPWSAEIIGSAPWLSLSASSGTTPSDLELRFTPGTLATGFYAATVRLTSGPATFDVPVSLEIDTLSPVQIRADLLRPQVFALNDGSAGGEVVVLSESAAMTKVIAVGKGPRDSCISPDGKFLYTANFSDATISEIDLDTLRVTRVRPVTLNKGTNARRFAIAAGRDGLVYHTDAATAPVLRVIDFATGELRATYAEPGSKGVGPLWFDSLRQRLYFHGEQSGEGFPHVVALSTETTQPLLALRGPVVNGSNDYFSSGRILGSLNGDRLVSLSRIHLLPDLTPSGTDLTRLPHAYSAYGDFAVNNQAVVDCNTRATVGTPPFAISDFTRGQNVLVGYNSSLSAFGTWSLPANVIAKPLAFTPQPADGAAIPLDAPFLSWNAQPHVEGYRLFIGADRDAVAAAIPGSLEDRGLLTGTSFALNPPPAPGTRMFWRVDLIRGGTTLAGNTQAATYAPFRVTPDRIARRLPLGIAPQAVSLDVLDASGQAVAWTVTESIPWFTPAAASGAAGTPLTGTISTSGLAAGGYAAGFTVSSAGLSLPVSLSISLYQPILEMLVRDPVRPTTIYGVHRGSQTAEESQILSIDTATATITRAVDAGRFVYDFSVDPAGARLYAANPTEPRIEVVDLASFTRLPSLPAATGIYGVAADGRGRLVLYRPAGGQNGTLSLADALTGNVLGSASGFATNNTVVLGQIDPVANRYHAKTSDNQTVVVFDLATNQPQLVKTVSTGSSGRPFFSGDGSRMFMGLSTYTPDVGLIRKLDDFPRATDSRGAVVVTRNELRWADSGLTIAPLASECDLAAVSADDRRAILWNSSTRTLTRLELAPLVALPGPRPQPGETRAAGQALELSWPSVAGATGYRVFAGTTEAAVTAAAAGSPLQVGQAESNTFQLATPAFGFRWFWRVDAMTGAGTVKGATWWFDVPLPELAPAVSVDNTPNGMTRLHAGANGLTKGLPGDGWSYLYRYDASDGRPVPVQEIQTNPSGYQPQPVPVLGDRWLVVGDTTHSSASMPTGGLFLHEYRNGRWQWLRTIVPPGVAGRSRLGAAVAADGSLILAGMPEENSYGKRGRVAAYREWPDFTLVQEFQASDGAADDGFGSAIAIQGNRAIIGAPGDFTRQGRAYIYEFAPATESWVQRAALLPNPASASRHGSAVAIDGDIAAVGSTGDEFLNQVFIFTRATNGSWTRTATINDPSTNASGRWFGSALAIAGDTLFIGAFGDQNGGTDGKVHVYHRNGTSWYPGAVIANPTARWGFGDAIAARDGVLYVSSADLLHSYRIRDLANRAPRFTSEPPLQFVRGRAVDLPLAATDPDGPAGLVLQSEWLPAGLVLEDLGEGRARITGTPTGAAGSSGFARWRVRDPQGAQAWQGARVTVLAETDGPAFVSAPVSGEATGGSDLPLRATVSGAGPFRWQWRKDGVDLPGETGPELNLLEVSAGDAGSYTVVVRNTVGAIESPPALVTVLPAGPSGGDWPMLGGSSAHSGRHPGALENHRFTPAWSTPVRTGMALHRAAIAGGKAWVTAHSANAGLPQAAALDLKTGAVLWEHLSDSSQTINPPAWYQNRVYFQLNRALVCLDAATGTRQWSSPFDAQFESHESPTVTADGIFINGGAYGGMYRFGLDGRQIFFRGLPQVSGWTPAIDRGRLFTCVSGNFIEHQPADGATIWSVNDTDGSNYVGIRGNAALVVGSALTCIDLPTRAIRWKVGGSFELQAALSAKTAYAIEADTVRSFALASGAPGPVFRTGAGTSFANRLIGQPIILNDRLLVSNRTKTWVFNLADGSILQTLDAGGRLSYSDRHLLVAGDDGTLRAFFANVTPSFTAAMPQRIDAGAEGARIDLDLSGFVSDPDAGDTPWWSIESVSNPSLFQSIEIDPVSGDLSVTYNSWQSGESVVVAAVTDSAGNTARSAITFVLPPHAEPDLQVAASLTLNRQTGLYEHRITVTNAAAREVGGFDLALTGLPAGVTVNNASAREAGVWTIHHRQPLAAGASVTLLVEYHAPVRGTVIAPEAAVSLVTEPESDPVAGAAGLAVDRCEVMEDRSLLIEFTSIPGSLYEIQYSDNAIDWKTSPVMVRAAGNRVQWIDRGPPRTDTPPSTKSSRFYRVREITAP